MTYDSHPNFAYCLDDYGNDLLGERRWSRNLSLTRSISPVFGIMEQQSGANGWNTRMLAPTPRPGQMTLWAMQSIAHGSILTEERTALLEEYVASGGVLVMGCRTGYKDTNGRCVKDRLPGLAAKLTGTDIPEYSLVAPDEGPIKAEWDGESIEAAVFTDIRDGASERCARRRRGYGGKVRSAYLPDRADAGYGRVIEKETFLEDRIAAGRRYAAVRFRFYLIFFNFLKLFLLFFRYISSKTFYIQLKEHGLNDRILIHEIQKGKKELLNVVIERYYGDIFRFCTYLTGNAQDGADLTQETFCKFIRYVDSYRFQSLKAYLYAVARNACMDYFRGKSVQVPLEDADRADGTEEGFSRAELRSDLFMQLQKLSAEQREAILLFYYEELRLREIARITGAPLSTVKSRIRQGLRRLKKFCEEEGITL